MTANLTLAATRVDRIAYGASRGQSYSQTEARIARVLPLLDGYPALQAQVVAALGARWKSLGNRSDDLEAARDAIRAVVDAEATP